SFVGREHEVAELRDLLASTRLLTLTGAGGVGKTRLALCVAKQEPERYRDGAWLVELAPLQDASLVPHIVANVFNVRENPQEALVTSLPGRLQPLELLLIRNNGEPLVSACGELVELLLRRSPGVRILATSRTVLGVPGETNWRVPPLTVPDTGIQLTAAGL